MRTIVFVCAALVLARAESAAGQACRAIPHTQLEALLPTALPALVRQMPHGETDNQEAVSRTTVDYEQPSGAGTISLELMDSCRNPVLLSQLREYLKTGPPPTPGTVFRSVAIRGFAAYEEWTAESQHTEIHILVADRFMVKVTGGLVDVQAVRDAAQSINLSKLEMLR